MSVDRFIYEEQTAVIEVTRVYTGAQSPAELLEAWLRQRLDRRVHWEGPGSEG